MKNELNVATAAAKKAGEIIGIEMLDHIIISRNGSYSFKKHDWK